MDYRSTFWIFNRFPFWYRFRVLRRKAKIDIFMICEWFATSPIDLSWACFFSLEKFQTFGKYRVTIVLFGFSLDLHFGIVLMTLAMKQNLKFSSITVYNRQYDLDSDPSSLFSISFVPVKGFKDLKKYHFYQYTPGPEALEKTLDCHVLLILRWTATVRSLVLPRLEIKIHGTRISI